MIVETEGFFSDAKGNCVLGVAGESDFNNREDVCWLTKVEFIVFDSICFVAEVTLRLESATDAENGVLVFVLSELSASDALNGLVLAFEVRDDIDLRDAGTETESLVLIG